MLLCSVKPRVAVLGPGATGKPTKTQTYDDAVPFYQPSLLGTGFARQRQRLWDCEGHCSTPTAENGATVDGLLERRMRCPTERARTNARAETLRTQEKTGTSFNSRIRETVTTSRTGSKRSSRNRSMDSCSAVSAYPGIP